MTVPSNLYAEKIFAEHPTTMWALDDNADYISLVSESERNMTTWTITDGSATTSSVDVNQPFEQSVLNSIEGDVPSSSSGSVICVSPNIINFKDMDPDRKTFAVGAYFYSTSAYLQSVEIGYEYTDTTTSQVIRRLKKFNTSIFQTWSFISETFKIPDENTNLRLVIKFNYSDGGDDPSDYQFYVNGFTLGQWCEDFNTVSLGQEYSPLPSSIALTGLDSIPADAYGLGGANGYYLIKDNGLMARNTGVPMVYGATGITRLRPNGNDPSLIVPGKGFLNKSGQFKEYTAEFWIRINSNTYEPKRVFGPISSTDGLYVESGFLTLVIGKKFASHFVGEWFRPMLIDVRLIRNTASVLLNGAEIISLSIDTDSLDLPDALDNSGKDQDWLGFYAYEDVSPIEIDCVAIYPYSVAINVAKRRWVYGQGVLSPELINSAYGGTQAFIDYPFADYTANYTYPDFARWDQGSFDNLRTTSTALSTPNYSLPNISLGTKTLEDLYLDNQSIQNSLDDKFITFRPNSSWNSQQCYFNFFRFNLLSDQTAAFYGVFSTDDLVSEQTLFKIYNQTTGNYFSIVKDADLIKYVLVYNGVPQEEYLTLPILSDEKFAVGLQINTISDYFGGNINAFFQNQNNLKMYVAGDEFGSSQFTGKIYSIGISTPQNAAQITSNFEENGIAIIDDSSVSGYVEPTNAIELLKHTASYTLLPIEAYGSYFLDIGVAGSWEDYLPLSYFGQYVKNEQGKDYYDLDFLQFNLGYPAPTKLAEFEETGSWTYDELKQTYQFPVQRTYTDLDNSLFTGWNDYEDMRTRSVKYYEYDTADASIRSYLTFQYIDTGANAPSSAFTTVLPAREGSIIDIDNYPDWLTTKFEVVDNTLMYPTKTVDFNKLAIVYRLDFNIRGILSKPISLRRVELTSQALNDNSFNPIGTRFGVNVFPYTRSGLYFDYKAKNPFSIYKGSTPYLYLNRTSGIEVRGDFDPLVSRGLSVPINTASAADYEVSATQIWMRSDLDEFPLSPIELFEIEYKDDTIKFFMQAVGVTGRRAKIFAKSLRTGKDFNGLTYYWNGVMVREPVLTIKEWGVLGIRFAQSLSFDAYLGGINLIGPMVFNNIAYYQANNLQQVQSFITRPWLGVKTDGVLNFDWAYWDNNFIWDGVLIISASDLYGVDPSNVYKTYIGTNKIIIDDDEGLMVDADRLKVYSDTSWTARVGTPV
jgi:hypothetical protein